MGWRSGYAIGAVHRRRPRRRQESWLRNAGGDDLQPGRRPDPRGPAWSSPMDRTAGSTSALRAWRTGSRLPAGHLPRSRARAAPTLWTLRAASGWCRLLAYTLAAATKPRPPSGRHLPPKHCSRSPGAAACCYMRAWSLHRKPSAWTLAPRLQGQAAGRIRCPRHPPRSTPRGSNWGCKNATRGGAVIEPNQCLLRQGGLRRFTPTGKDGPGPPLDSGGVSGVGPPESRSESRERRLDWLLGLRWDWLPDGSCLVEQCLRAVGLTARRSRPDSKDAPAKLEMKNEEAGRRPRRPAAKWADDLLAQVTVADVNNNIWAAYCGQRERHLDTRTVT